MAKDNNIAALLNEESMLSIDDGSIAPFDVDTEQIDKESRDYADEVIKNIAKLYGDDEFLDKNPRLKIRLNAELDTLRRNYKMCRVDEIMFDRLANAVGQHADNAALWIAYARHQSTIMSLQTKIDASVDRITKLIDTYKNYQTEIDFRERTDEESLSESGMTNRGSKAFMEQIQSMIIAEENKDEKSE